MKPLKIAVLASGRGNVLPKIVNAILNKSLHASIEIVITNQPHAFVLEQAKLLRLKTVAIPSIRKTRIEHENEISVVLKAHEIDLILLAGYMRILSCEFVDQWKNKILNAHPSLLPAFAGLMDLKVHQAVLDSGISETGCTIHYVDKTVDGGTILLQKKCVVSEHDTPEMLKYRVQEREGEAWIEAIKLFQQSYCKKGEHREH